MFGVNMEHPSRMLGYASALKKYNSITPIRGRSDQNTRPLARRSNDNLTIRQDPTTQDIIVQLYNTDIIRFSAEGDGYNNTITLEPYCSVLTNRVVWSVLGPHVNPCWSDRRPEAFSPVTFIGGKYYRTPDYVVIQPHETGWYPVGGTKPFEVPAVNRKEARAALKLHGFDRFKLWAETKAKLGVPATVMRYTTPSHFSARHIANMLAKGEDNDGGWPDLYDMLVCTKSATFFDQIRRAIYIVEMCYDTQSIDHFDNWDQLNSAINRARRAM